MEEVEDITSHGRVPPTPGAAEGPRPWRLEDDDRNPDRYGHVVSCTGNRNLVSIDRRRLFGGECALTASVSELKGGGMHSSLSNVRQGGGRRRGRARFPRSSR